MGLGKPEFEVALAAVFFVEVVECALPVAFEGELGVMGEAVLDGAADDVGGFDLAVGFGYDFAVEAAGFVGGGGAVVFDGLGHEGYLLGGEPVSEGGVGEEYLSGDEVVALASFDESEVVVGGNGVGEEGVGVVECGEVEALVDDGADVGLPVGGVEIGVAREDVALDVCLEGYGNVVVHIHYLLYNDGVVFLLCGGWRQSKG